MKFPKSYNISWVSYIVDYTIILYPHILSISIKSQFK